MRDIAQLKLVLVQEYNLDCRVDIKIVVQNTNLCPIRNHAVLGKIRFFRAYAGCLALELVSFSEIPNWYFGGRNGELFIWRHYEPL